jgi:hypothetical protein
MSASQRVGLGFHQLGLLLAATLLAIGLPLMVADAVRFKLWDAGQGDIPVLVAGDSPGALRAEPWAFCQAQRPT